MLDGGLTGADLEELRALLLRDRDGDGFPDALTGPAWIAGAGPGDVDAGVAAAAELLARLADRALVLSMDTHRWRHDEPGVYLGPGGPPRPEAVADRTWPLSGGASIRRVGEGLWLSGPDLHAAVATALAGISADPPPGPELRERWAGGFAARGGAPEALGAALRQALATTRAEARLVVPFDEARVRSVVDGALAPGAWEMRRRRRGGDERLELAGHDAVALGHACAWFASCFPRLPDGTWIDDVDAALSDLVAARTRDGRVAAAAAAARRASAAGDGAVAATLPSPPADAARLLRVPVRNGARDGAVRRWAMRVEWEGERLVAAAGELLAALPAAGPVVLEAYASESQPLRSELERRLRAIAADAGVEVAGVRVRHAYRPALHWLLEEVVPDLPQTCTVLRLRASRPAGGGAEERWLRELHPVAELIEAARPGLRVELGLGPERPTPRYEAEAVDGDGIVGGSWDIEPPVAASPLSDGGSVLVTTGGVRVRQAGAVVADAHVVTDADALWRWFVDEVLPELLTGIDPAASPAFYELAVVASLSEPDDLLPIDHETDSVLESLHEDLLFGVLEVAASATAGGTPRQASPGRILPFVRGDPGGATRASVLLRPWGSGRTGVQTASGAWVPAPGCPAAVRVAAVEGRGDAVVGVTLEVAAEADGADAATEASAAAVTEDALSRLAWLARARPAAFPAGLQVRLRAAGETGPGVVLGPFVAPPAPGPLPARPLHPREALAAARAVAARHPSVRFSTPRETALGQPLGVLEVGPPDAPTASRVRRAAWRPSVLLSARQHANEATSTQAAFGWIERLLADGALLRRANLVVHPLENPDGARLHAALCALAPHHMHHAARYTAFGGDLHVDPRVHGETIPESRLRHDVARDWRPCLHLNDHGYPAHGWVRAQTGHLPRGFENWSLPVGHLTILITHGGDEAAAAALREALADAVERALVADADIRDRTRAQVRRSARYRGQAAPFTYRSDLPFWLQHRVAPSAGGGNATPGLAPHVSLITEVPDETVTGADWDACVRSHALVNEAVLRAFLDRWSDDAGT
jgi:hypothetical protein